MMNRLLLALIALLSTSLLSAQHPVPVKPRVLISTDIGGTDPDDNQSMAHLLMYADRFNLEGLVSSPSYGEGNKAEILRMIDLYEQDLPRLQQHSQNFPSPAYLRSISKQGRKGAAPYRGFSMPTEGSNWIISCARKTNSQPLWVLVWGGLDDLAQALHDDPQIQKKIKVYWIGGPNKKWGANGYAYIASHFPNLWFIECNASFNGFFSNNGVPDSLSNKNYYKNYIRGAGALGKDYNQNRYQGNVKMGDTPSLLYMMDGDPNDPFKPSWGGSFEKITYSPRVILHRNTTIKDTVPVYAVMELHFKGPQLQLPADSACFTMTVKASIGVQKWEGYYLGKGDYVVRYIPKQTETLSYTISSGLPGFSEQQGVFFVSNNWPGKPRDTNYKLGSHWYSDRHDPALYDGIWQGAQTVLRWRNDVLLDWAKRWDWLR